MIRSLPLTIHQMMPDLVWLDFKDRGGSASWVNVIGGIESSLMTFELWLYLLKRECYNDRHQWGLYLKKCFIREFYPDDETSLYLPEDKEMLSLLFLCSTHQELLESVCNATMAKT